MGRSLTLNRAQPNPQVDLPWRCVAGKRIQIAGKSQGGPSLMGSSDQGPRLVASMVMTLKMMVLVTVMVMLVMATLAMWDLWGLWDLRDLWGPWYLWYLWSFWDLWDLRDQWGAASTGRFICSIHGATSLCRSCSGPNLRAIAAR